MEFAHFVDGEKIKIARPTKKKMKEIAALNVSDTDWDDLERACQICLEGDLSEIDWENTDIRAMQEILADFLSQVNPIAAQRLKSLNVSAPLMNRAAN